jgi:hypothetical protein
MIFNSGVMNVRRSSMKIAGGIALALALGFSSSGVSAQRRGDRYGSAFTRLEPGMNIRVRTNDLIDSARTDYRVYTGVIADDVRGDDGRLAIPRGSTVELIVRRIRNNELSLDLESVDVNGQRYAIKTDPNQIVGTSGTDSIVGSIVGALSGGEVGRNVRIPRNSVLNFRLERPLDVGVPDRGVNRDGYHYHDWYGRDR